MTRSLNPDEFKLFDDSQYAGQHQRPTTYTDTLGRTRSATGVPNDTPKQTGTSGMETFHTSIVRPNAFMKAPTIHTGGETTALQRKEDLRTYERGKKSLVHKINVSQNAEYHPEVLTDAEANYADKRYLEKSNYPVPRSVEDSAELEDEYRPTLNANNRDYSRNYSGYQSARRVVAAAKALSENKIIEYENTVEGGTSYIIPSPHFNAKAVARSSSESRYGDGGDFEPEYKPNKGVADTDPHTQPVLPMDYSGLNMSRDTKSWRKLQRNE